MTTDVTRVQQPYRPPSVAGFTKPKDTASAQRMRALRAYMGYDQPKKFAEFLGVGVGSYNQIENGGPISKAMAFAMCKKIPGMTLDWVWLGKNDLPHDMAIELETIMAIERETIMAWAKP